MPQGLPRVSVHSIFRTLRNSFKASLYKLSSSERRKKLTEVFEFWNEIDQHHHFMSNKEKNYSFLVTGSASCQSRKKF